MTPPDPPQAAAGLDPRPARIPGSPILLTLGLIAVMVIAVLTIQPLRDAAGDAVSGETGALRRDLRGLGIGGIALVAALAALHTFVWYPAEILDAAVGFVYGFWPGMAMLTVLWTAQGMLAYEIGRRAARPVTERIVGARRLDTLERAVESGGVTLLLAARLVPIVPFSLFSFVAGTAAAPRFRFAWTTAIGYIPITAVAVYLGANLEELSPTDPRIWIAVAAVLALLLGARRLKPLFENPPRD